jgi:hypothetical protein
VTVLWVRVRKLEFHTLKPPLQIDGEMQRAERPLWNGITIARIAEKATD